MKENILFPRLEAVQFALYLLIVGGLLGCTSKNRKTEVTSTPSYALQSIPQMKVKYAQGFSLDYKGDTVIVSVCDPDDSTRYRGRYALIRGGDANNSHVSKEFDAVINTPITGTICMTTPQLSYFLSLNALDKVVGMASANMLHNHQVLDAIQSGHIGRIGMEGDFDIEQVIGLSPQIILVSPFKRGGYDVIRDLSIPLVTFLAYKESHPLGQAEWVKFVGMLTGKEEQAQHLFDEIEERYNNLKQLTSNVEHRPSVMTGELRSDNWYVLGGKSYIAQQIRDAGATYFLKDNEETGGINLDFEKVYALGEQADFWRMMNLKAKDGFSYQSIEQTDPRYADFNAFKKRQIFYCDLQNKPFYEEVAMAPDVVLADLIKIFHPHLLPKHKTVYYHLLN